MSASTLSILLDGVNEYVTMGDLAVISFERDDQSTLSILVKTTATTRLCRRMKSVRFTTGVFLETCGRWDRSVTFKRTGDVERVTFFQRLPTSDSVLQMVTGP